MYLTSKWSITSKFNIMSHWLKRQIYWCCAWSLWWVWGPFTSFLQRNLISRRSNELETQMSFFFLWTFINVSYRVPIWIHIVYIVIRLLLSIICLSLVFVDNIYIYKLYIILITILIRYNSNNLILMLMSVLLNFINKSWLYVNYILNQ
jgi:hypothetical protein